MYKELEETNKKLHKRLKELEEKQIDILIKIVDAYCVRFTVFGVKRQLNFTSFKILFSNLELKFMLPIGDRVYNEYLRRKQQKAP